MPLTACLLAQAASAAQIELVRPPGSNTFGDGSFVLPNGNIVVRDTSASIPNPGAGAVHLFATDGTLISTLRGASADDAVGSGGVTILANGNFVVLNPLFKNGAALDAGAVTWCHSATGCNGTVSAVNSLVGSTSNDLSGSVVALANGNYLVLAPQWDRGAIANAGAVAWCSGSAGCNGTLSTLNALVGSKAEDRVGSGAALPLASGDAVIASPNWDDSATVDVGAVTRIPGSGGLIGTLTAANSRIAGSANSALGAGGLVALSNGHYLIVSPSFDNGAVADVGAVTWCPGTAACIGTATPLNSLVGALSGDAVGSSGVAALADGNYVVASDRVDIGGITDAGAVTLVSGSAAFSGVVSAANSLFGTAASDRVGESGVDALANGNFAVSSTLWDNGAVANAGAVTFGNGTTGITGPVSAINSLVGSSAEDRVGNVLPLANGHFVVHSPNWNNGPVNNAGSIAWCNGNSGCAGPISAANALVGTSSGPVGPEVVALGNGNYAVGSPTWSPDGSIELGAVTWASGSSGLSGTISAANSLLGANDSDNLGYHLAALADGSFVANAPGFDFGGNIDVGGVIRLPGEHASSGVLSAATVLRGLQTGDQFGASGLDALPDGRFTVRSDAFDNGAIVDAGAIAMIPAGGLTGPVPAVNQIIGLETLINPTLNIGYDPPRRKLVVGHETSYRVTLLRLPSDEAQLFANGFE